jgi:LacI family transcriptional regulator
VLEDNGYEVPGQVSVIGFDDVLLSQYSRPKLTTLHYPIEKMAENAAKLALSLSDPSKQAVASTQKKYMPTLVKRESVGIANQSKA